MVFVVNFINNFYDVIVNGLSGVASKNKIDVVEIFGFDFVDSVAIVFW